MDYRPNEVELQRRLRIRLSIFAFAYEIDNIPLIEDAEYDFLSQMIDPEVLTGDDIMDTFFKEVFVPYSGMWIHNHPELNKIKRIYEIHFSPRLRR